MQKNQPLILGGTFLSFLCGTLICAQTVPSTVPLAAREHQPRALIVPRGFGWVFDLKGKKYEARISREEIASGPEWSVGAPLPLTFGKAEEIARTELRKLVRDDSTWEVTELALRRLDEETQSKWYCVVKLMPKLRDRNVISDLFVMPIGFSGASGRVQAYRP